MGIRITKIINDSVLESDEERLTHKIGNNFSTYGSVGHVETLLYRARHCKELLSGDLSMYRDYSPAVGPKCGQAVNSAMIQKAKLAMVIPTTTLQ